MRPAYEESSLSHLEILKEAQRWKRQGLIAKDQFDGIGLQYPCPFYHPNLVIRILLFLATLIGLGGVTGLLGVMVSELGETAIYMGCLIYGFGSFMVLDRVLVREHHHYKSGITEALLYHSAAFTIAGASGLTGFNIHFTLLLAILVAGLCAIRYIDLVLTTATLCTSGYFLFYELYELGPWGQTLIPIALMIAFGFLYFLFRRLGSMSRFAFWTIPIIVGEVFSLLAVYASGNYLVVRELSVSLMDLNLEPGQDIPMAFLFYALTVLLPVAYLYFGIRLKDLALLRTSLLVLAFAVFTFKFYYSSGHHEITFTIGGFLLLMISLVLMRYLKIPRNGITGENILSERWAHVNLEAFIISQTLGGNKAPGEESFRGSGGTFGGGGASGEF